MFIVVILGSMGLKYPSAFGYYSENLRKFFMGISVVLVRVQTALVKEALVAWCYKMILSTILL